MIIKYHLERIRAMWYDFPIDYGIFSERSLRRLVSHRLQKYSQMVAELNQDQIQNIQQAFRQECSSGPIAINTSEANQQHYEVPIEFFTHILSQHMKYSGSIWNKQINMEVSDETTLDCYIDRAQMSDGNKVLELGAGWGSLSLHIAQKHKNTSVTTVTNSHLQKRYINNKIKEMNLTNITVIQSDINDYNTDTNFDTIFSIEMFEHLRNPAALLRNITRWLNPAGTLFIQVFSHKKYPQFFDNPGSSWMARHFFTGGMMPYAGFFSDICDSLETERQWIISGTHYHNTLESWLRKLDDNNNQLLSSLQESWPNNQAKIYINRYRMFLLICSEMFRFNKGQDWHTMHYLFQK